MTQMHHLIGGPCDGKEEEIHYAYDFKFLFMTFEDVGSAVYKQDENYLRRWVFVRTEPKVYPDPYGQMLIRYQNGDPNVPI